MKNKLNFYKYLKLLGGLISIIFLFIIGVDHYVSYATANNSSNDVHNIIPNDVGLLLGTRKTVVNGNVNLYYKYRIQAALDLYRANKINFILVSGDNSRIGYDEPTDMMKDLIAGGVPRQKIFLDYAGFRTLDAVVRAKEIFGQNKVTIISQQFHNERAIYIARQKGIEAVGFNAKDVPAKYGTKTLIREKLARIKMLLDIILNKSPKYLGEQIEIQ